MDVFSDSHLGRDVSPVIWFEAAVDSKRTRLKTLILLYRLTSFLRLLLTNNTRNNYEYIP